MCVCVCVCVWRTQFWLIINRNGTDVYLCKSEATMFQCQRNQRHHRVSEPSLSYFLESILIVEKVSWERPYDRSICSIFPLRIEWNREIYGVATRFFARTPSVVQWIIRILEVANQFLKKSFWLLTTTSVNRSNDKNGLTLKTARFKRYATETILDADDADYLTLLVNVPTQTWSKQHEALVSELMCFK